MTNKPLEGKKVLITGAAKRVGRLFALSCGKAGAEVILHHGHSHQEALILQEELAAGGTQSWVLQTDLSDPEETSQLILKASAFGTIDCLINSAAIFENLSFKETDLKNWQEHLTINLTAPFLISQAFANQIPEAGQGRILNILDWRALRPGADHFAYTISKAALAAMTQSMAQSLAPNITVNGLALGAILPPEDPLFAEEPLLKKIPANRWSKTEELESALLFLLAGPAYITGEIVHLDGGRHLV